MPNPWIDHVKKYALAQNLSYREALSKAKQTYTKEVNTTGGSRNSNIIRILEGKKKLNINRVNNPSNHLLTKYKTQFMPTPLESDIIDIKNDYMTKVKASYMLGRNNLGKSGKKQIITLRDSYYKLTGEHLPIERDLKKQWNKELKQLKVEDRKADEMTINKKDTPNNISYDFSKGRKKRKDVVI